MDSTSNRVVLAACALLGVSAAYYVLRRPAYPEPCLSSSETTSTLHTELPTEESSLFDLEGDDNFATSYAIPIHRHKTQSFQENTNSLRSPPADRDRL